MALEVNRNIIGALLSYSAKSGRAIEIKLWALQMEMEVAEKQVKSKLMDVINPKEYENFAQALRENDSDFVINFIALV